MKLNSLIKTALGLLIVFCSFVFSAWANQAELDLINAWKSEKVNLMIEKIYKVAKTYEKAVNQIYEKDNGDFKKVNLATKNRSKAYENALEEIFSDQSVYGDCALVRLIGEFNKDYIGQTVFHVTERGKRMLLILELRKKAKLWETESKEGEENALDFVNDCIEAIKNDKVLNKPIAPSTLERNLSAEGLQNTWDSFRVESMVKSVYSCEDSFEKKYKEMELAGDKKDPYRTSEYNSLCKSIEKIFLDETVYGDCAVVQLMGDFNDASAGENVEFYITERGKRMLPILNFAMGHPIAIMKNKNEKGRIKFIERCLKAVKDGEILGVSIEYGGF